MWGVIQLGAVALLLQCPAAHAGTTDGADLTTDDREVVAERDTLIAGLVPMLGQPGLAFEQKRDIVLLLGWLRPHSATAIQVLANELQLHRPQQKAGAAVIFKIESREMVAPGVAAAARAGLPAVPSLMQTAVGGAGTGSGGPRAAQEALSKMLGRAARYWYDHTIGKRGPGERTPLPAPLRVAADLPMPLPPEGNALWSQRGGPRYALRLPVALPDLTLKAMQSVDERVRDGPLWAARARRNLQIRELTSRVAGADPRSGRVSAAIALGLIRAVSQESGEALVAMLGEERVDPGKRLTDADTPAALALVRIGVPIVPILTDTIRTSQDKHLRSNCAGVMATMLGRYAKPWLEDVMRQSDSAEERMRVAEVLQTWSPQCEGEGYWAQPENRK